MLKAKSILLVFEKWDVAVKDWKEALDAGQSTIMTIANR
jgi:hypothetical protein